MHRSPRSTSGYGVINTANRGWNAPRTHACRLAASFVQALHGLVPYSQATLGTNPHVDVNMDGPRFHVFAKRDKVIRSAVRPGSCASGRLSVPSPARAARLRLARRLGPCVDDGHAQSATGPHTRVAVGALSQKRAVRMREKLRPTHALRTHCKVMPLVLNRMPRTAERQDRTMRRACES